MGPILDLRQRSLQLLPSLARWEQGIGSRGKEMSEQEVRPEQGFDGPMPAVGADPRPPTAFKGFLYWYVTLQCALSVAASILSFGSITILLMLGWVDEATINQGIAQFEKVENVVGLVIGITLAFGVAKRVGVSFGPALGGYFLGNIISFAIMAPVLFGTDPIIVKYGYPMGVLMIVGMMLAYAVAVTIAIVVGRRRGARYRRMQALIEPFT